MRTDFQEAHFLIRNSGVAVNSTKFSDDTLPHMSIVAGCPVHFVSTGHLLSSIFFASFYPSFKELQRLFSESSFFLFSSRYLRISLLRTGIPTPIRRTTAKIVKSILLTSHFLVFHNPNGEPDRHSVHDNDEYMHKADQQYRGTYNRRHNGIVCGHLG